MKIIDKLTLKNLRMNKVRTIVTILGIILSVALITVVTGMVSSVIETTVVSSIQNTGDYDISLSGEIEERFIEKLKSNSDVRDIYTKRYMGLGEFKDSKISYTPYIKVFGLNENCFESGFNLSLAEGNFPKNSDELLLSPEFVKNSSKKYKTGDKITISFGQRYYKPDETTAAELGQENDTYIPIDSFTPYTSENEIFKKQNEKTYTISGILNTSGGNINDTYAFSCVCVYTLADINSAAETNIATIDPMYGRQEDTQTIFIRFNDNAERRYKEIFADLLGTEVKYLDNYIELSEEELEQFNADCAKSGVNNINFNVNRTLLMSKGIDLNQSNFSILMSLIAFIIFIIVVSSVFIIRNSFAISITEKTKLYGMLSATGATPKQIKRNVFFEGFILGIIGIPLGILLGAGVTAALIWLCNTVLAELLNGTSFVFKISLLGILASLVLGAVTIFFSAFSTAKRASRIPPIEAIRSNNDIKLSSKEQKKLKTPKFIVKLFGAGGNIAWKNMKRNRKKYRTTVISIVLSVAVYISIYSFVDYNLVYIKNIFNSSPYNIGVSPEITDPETGEALPSDEAIKKFDRIASLDSVDKYIYSTNQFINLSISCDALGDELKNTSYNNNYAAIEDDKYTVHGQVVALDKENFKKIVESNGMKLEDSMDKFFIYNSIKVSDESQNKHEYLQFLKDVKNTSFTITSFDYDQDTGEDINTEYNITLSGVTELIPTQPGMLDNYDVPIIYVSIDNYIKTFKPKNELFFNMSISSSNDEQFEEDANELCNIDKSIKINYILNYSKDMRAMNSITLILQIFVYGFIIVISLIGLTNVFNTITANMRLRRKEFAVLQSIGMTKREFNRMISLESLLYTLKSLMIGLPLGILASYVIYLIYASNLGDGSMPYIFPGLAVLISTFVVLMLVWVIMRFSIRKVRRQNIIETIRNDNI